MKKIISLLFAGFICLSSFVPCYAADFANPSLVDGAEYFTDAEAEKLTEQLDEVREKYDFDVAVYTEKEMSGSDAGDSAKKVFDNNGYGAGENFDGILLYICRSEREYRFITMGAGDDFFTDNGIAYIESKILSKLKKDDYPGAVEKYVKATDKLLKMAEDGKPYDRKPDTLKSIAIKLGIFIFVPLLIAYIMMQNKLSKMKTAVADDYAANYMKPGSKHIDMSRDIFMYSTITKRKKEKSESSDSDRGGSSSSGGSHDRGGGSF